MCKVCVAEGNIIGEYGKVVLENRTPPHNKVYTIWAEQEKGGTYRVVCRFGRIGKTAQHRTKSNGLTINAALAFVESVAEEKVAKRGYTRRVCVGVKV